MEQVKRNIPYVLFISLGLKLLILGSSNIFDILALFVLGLGLSFFELQFENKKFIKLSNKINDLEAQSKIMTDLLADLKTNINSVKAVQGYKQQNVR